jgi:hypothetical protein
VPRLRTAWKKEKGRRKRHGKKKRRRRRCVSIYTHYVYV